MALSKMKVFYNLKGLYLAATGPISSVWNCLARAWMLPRLQIAIKMKPSKPLDCCNRLRPWFSGDRSETLTIARVTLLPTGSTGSKKKQKSDLTDRSSNHLQNMFFLKIGRGLFERWTWIHPVDMWNITWCMSGYKSCDALAPETGLVMYSAPALRGCSCISHTAGIN